MMNLRTGVLSKVALRDRIKENQGDNLVAKYMNGVGALSRSGKWNVTWRDMSRPGDLFRLIRKVKTMFKCIVMSSERVREWNEHIEDIAVKNMQMRKTDVSVIACDELSRVEVYAFASVQEGVDFAKLVKQLASRGIPKSSAVSIAYKHIDRKYLNGVGKNSI